MKLSSKSHPSSSQNGTHFGTLFWTPLLGAFFCSGVTFWGFHLGSILGLFLVPFLVPILDPKKHQKKIRRPSGKAQPVLASEREARFNFVKISCSEQHSSKRFLFTPCGLRPRLAARPRPRFIEMEPHEPPGCSQIDP